MIESRTELIYVKDSVAILQERLEREDREHFVVLMLDNGHFILGIHTVSIGNIHNTYVSPGEVFKAAILANAAAVVVAHNHPSGRTRPSREDYEVTDILRQVGDMFGIPVLDHVIVGHAGKYFSLKESGYFDAKQTANNKTRRKAP